MSVTIDHTDRDKMSYEEKNKELFNWQKLTLDILLEHGAITKAQHDKSLHDLIEKMGIEE